jgi:N-acetylneuraminic acid mutarotase
MLQGRAHHTATLLQDGTVLVVGGLDNNDGLASAERYDPTAGTWTGAGTMSGPHWEHRAVLLDDGKVLVIGGCGGGPSFVCMVGVGVEIYDPSVTSGNPWSQVNSMLVERRSHCATKLDDGKVLVAGGFDNQKDHTGIEIYNPQTGFWSSLPAQLSVARNLATATTLPSGKVVIIGGTDGTNFHDSIVIFDPAGSTIQTLNAKLQEPRAGHTATLLPNGKVLIVGGRCSWDLPATCAVGNAELYDPNTDTVTQAGSPGSSALDHTATLLPIGQVLVAGGAQSPKVARLYSSSGWAQTATMFEEYVNHAAVLVGGKVIVIGGEAGSFYDGSKNVEIYSR